MRPRVKLTLIRVALLLSMTLLLFGGVLGVDLYLHQRYEKAAGLNRRGYRGPMLGRKQEGERRVAVLGGSTAFGYGVTWQAAIPAVLEQKLKSRSDAGRTYRVVNLAYNNEGAYSFKHTLRDYAELGYDVVVLYTGYNDLDLDRDNTRVYRHESPIFRLTGYVPIFPLVFREKAMVLRYGGDLEAAYRGEKTVFTPNRGERISAAALETVANVAQSLERQLGRLTGDEPVDAASMERRLSRLTGDEPVDSGSAEPTCDDWEFYCDQVSLAVDAVLAQESRVVVVTQPHIADSHVVQQQALKNMLEATHGRNADVRHVDLGEAVSLDDVELAWDGMHLTAAGNDIIATELVDPVIAMLR